MNAQTAIVAILPGCPVVHGRSGRRGFVVDEIKSKSGGYMIGAGGLQPIRSEYLISWGDSLQQLPDSIVMPWIETAARLGLPSCPDITAEMARATAAQSASRDDARAKADAAAAALAAFRADAAGRVPDWAQAVIVATLEHDDCDSMSDYYNVTTSRRVILGFSRHTRDLFPELRKAAALFSQTAELATAPDSAEHRAKYSMGGGYFLKAGSSYSSGWKVKKERFYSNRIPDGPAEWLADLEPAAPAESAAAPGIGHNSSGGAFTIEKHHHTKGGFDMWLCISADRVERDEFERQRDAAKAAGGWYSRAWGRVPGGFAFKSEAAALAFAGEGGGASDEMPATPSAARVAAPAPALVDKLRDLAAGMQSAIDDKFRDRLANTPKRQREAASARNDGRHLERAQKGLLALAAAHDAGTVPAVLASVRTKAAALDLAQEAFDHGGGYYDAPRGKGVPRDATPAALAFWQMAEGGAPDPQAAAAEELRRKIDGLRFANIPGYFPTPAALVARMIDAAQLRPGMRVLEPSAGSGAISEAVRAAEPSAVLHCAEKWNTLAEILTAKGFDLVARDCLEMEPSAGRYDRILMNPPFEKGQDAEHVRKAFDLLAPGGRIVAIMSAGTFQRSDAKAAGFRAWLDVIGGSMEQIEAGAFKVSGTGVASAFVVIDN